MLFKISVKTTFLFTIINLTKVYIIYNITQSTCVTNIKVVLNLYKIASSVFYSCSDPDNNCMTIMLDYNNS